MSRSVTKVSPFRRNARHESSQRPGEWKPHLAVHCTRNLFGWAALAGAKSEEDREQPPAPVPTAVLQQRASKMFSGKTGSVVASDEGCATSGPTYELLQDVILVVEALPAQLFDRNATHRPCGLTSPQEAAAATSPCRRHPCRRRRNCRTDAVDLHATIVAIFEDLATRR